MENRKILFRALTGSNLYNLNHENSDKDYKIIFLPEFNDLFNCKDYTQSKTSDELDYEMIDIRKFIKQCFKGNGMYIEILFSNDIEIGDISYSEKILLNNLIENRELIVKYNLKGLYNYYYNVAINNIEKSKHSKMLAQGIRMLLVLKRYADNNFNSFEQAVRFKDDDFERNHLIHIKTHKLEELNMVETSDFIKNLKNEIDEYHYPKYMLPTPKSIDKENIEDLVKTLILLNIK